MTIGGADVAKKLEETFQGQQDVPTVHVVLEELGPSFTDWYPLGVFLDLDTQDLDAIRGNKQEVNMQFISMVNCWLRTKPEASWADLCGALRKLGKHTLAEDISCKYCKQLTTADELLTATFPADTESISDDDDWDPPTEFGVMFAKVIELLNESADVDDLKLYLEFCSHPRTHQRYINVKIIERCNTPGEILEALYPQYINFMHTHLLRRIVHRFGDDRSKSLVKQYEENFPRKKPLKRMREPLSNEEIEACPGTKRINVVYGRDDIIDNTTMMDVERVQQTIERNTGIDRIRIVYAKQTPGSVVQQTIVMQDREPIVHFEEAMENGYVECTMTTCAVTGAAGSGKSHTMYLALNEDPPDVRQSTGLVEPVRALSTVVGTSESGTSEWSKVDEDKLLDIVAGATSVTNAEEQPTVPTSPSPLTYSISGESRSTSLPQATPLLQTRRQPERFSEADTSEQVSKPDPSSHTEAVDEQLTKLAGLLEKPVGRRQVAKLDFLYFLDSGGQPQFHELLSSFIPNLSTILFVLNLSEKLNQHPVIEYYEEGKSICSYQSHHSHEQILKHCIRALQPEKRSDDSSSSSSPSIAVVGTHKDMELQCEGEPRDEKNRKLLDLLQPRFGDSLIFYHQLKELIFPVNAKYPSKEDKAVAGKLVEATIRSSAAKPVQIPLAWFMLEQVLRKLARERGTGVMHFDECREIAIRLRIKPSAFYAALKYLVSLNLFLYYPTVLPHVVFCVPQFFLDKINELVEHRHILCGGSSTLPRSAESTNITGLTGKHWLRFQNHGVFQEEFLYEKAFSRHYDKDIFTPADFLTLLEFLRIVGKVNTSDINTEYVIPSLLFELESDKLGEHRCNPQTSPAAPLLVHSPDEWPTSGVFCSLAASLLSTQNWEVMTDARNKPTCLYRNCFQFEHPRMPGSVTLIDSFDQGYFEVHVDDNAPLEECTKYCPEIRKSVFAALPPKAPVVAEVAFFCPNSQRGTHCPSSLHLAYMKPCNHWSCSENPAKVYGSLAESPNMTIWGITSSVSEDQEDSCNPTGGDQQSENVGQKPSTPPSNVASQPTPKICSLSGCGAITTDIGDLIDIGDYLVNLKRDQIFRLGLVLGLRAVPTLDIMKDSPTFLYDMLTGWLQGQDNVGRRGGHTWGALVKGLRHPSVAQNETADKIQTEKWH